jgi:hypothetical protein
MMKSELRRIRSNLIASANHMKQFSAVCELEKLYNKKSTKPLVEKLLKEIAENKGLDIYARNRANRILNPIPAIPFRK